MPRVRFEPTNPGLERANIFRALNSVSAVIGPKAN
jgi:hypothetical protein